MKKLMIQISDEAHLELLKIQLEKRVAGEKKTIAVVASDALEILVNKKAAK